MRSNAVCSSIAQAKASECNTPSHHITRIRSIQIRAWPRAHTAEVEKRWQHMSNLKFLLVVHRQIRGGRTYGFVLTCIYIYGSVRIYNTVELLDALTHQHARICASLAMPLKLPHISCSSLSEVRSFAVLSKTTGVLICNCVLRFLRPCCISVSTLCRQTKTIIHQHLISQPTCPACSN
jgi:hypothetical protein